MREFEEQCPELPLRQSTRQQQEGVKLSIPFKGIRIVPPEIAKRRMDRFLRDIR